MIEIAFWGQNQPSFKKAKEIIKRVHNIEISCSIVREVTEYVGGLLFQKILNNANSIWDNRSNIETSNKKDKLLLYVESDGAAVNTRIEDENGSTWRENKLAIFFSNKDIYKRKNKANMITHKEFVSYLGNVNVFRTLLFAKAVELKYWEYENIVFISDGATWLKNMINELFPVLSLLWTL